MARVIWIAVMAIVAVAAQASRPRVVDAQTIACGEHCVTSARCEAACWNCNAVESIEEGGNCGK
jgi:hypothetical protein